MRRWRRSDHRRTALGSQADRATFRALHNASLASPALRAGLTTDSAERSLGHLRALLGTPAAALTDIRGVLAWDGSGQHHVEDVPRFLPDLVDTGRTRVADLACQHPRCEVRQVVLAPLVVEGDDRRRARRRGGVRDRWAHPGGRRGGPLGLGPARARRARRLPDPRSWRRRCAPCARRSARTSSTTRSAPSPRFVRTDPDRARELLLEFADFTRYSFRRHGEYTTLAEELRSVERYLLLEQARFGDRLQVTLRIAPEVLPVAVPFLCIQPLVENAVRHGLEASAEKEDGVGRLSILARDLDQECVIEVEDDGTGEDPERVRRALAGDTSMDSVGLGNVDARLRNAYGDEYGLVVETAPGAGTKVTVRVPKFAPGVAASA